MPPFFSVTKHPFWNRRRATGPLLPMDDGVAVLTYCGAGDEINRVLWGIGAHES
jgi:hypothetical protein